MKTTTFALARRVVVAAVLTGAALLAPAIAIAANAQATTVSAPPLNERHHSGPDYWSITGARVGAPSEQGVSIYGGSHKHLWVEQQLYGPGAVSVPPPDTTVHQSR